MTDTTTSAPATDAGARISEYDCKLCGWQFTTIDGLWEHIPTHRLTQPQYAVLTKDRADLLAMLQAERERAEQAEQAEQALATLCAVSPHADGSVTIPWSLLEPILATPAQEQGAGEGQG